MLTLRKLVSCVLVLLVPASLFAADSAAAMLYTNGTAWLNGANVPKSSAIFVGDLVQTRTDSVANIKAPGTSVMVASDSLVQLKENAVKLEHGSLSVGTSKNLAAQVGGLKISPASAAWTEFQVTDTDGTVKIIAKKGDLTLSDGTTLPQGQQTTRDETDENNKKKKGGGAAPAAGGGILNSPVAIGVGSFVIGGLTAWVLVQGDDPLSPSSPR
jgi:hypothetical protein